MGHLVQVAGREVHDRLHLQHRRDAARVVEEVVQFRGVSLVVVEVGVLIRVTQPFNVVLAGEPNARSLSEGEVAEVSIRPHRGQKK